MLCPPTHAVKTPLLRCLLNTEIILINPYGLFCVSSRHNYGKFCLHGLQPSCQDTMPQASLTCEITFHNNVLLIISFTQILKENHAFQWEITNFCCFSTSFMFIVHLKCYP